MIFPMGLAAPKYLTAAFCDSTTVNGLAKPVLVLLSSAESKKPEEIAVGK